MRVLIDTCIIIDALQQREKFYENAKTIFLLCANRKFDGYLSAKSFTDIYYITHKQMHNDKSTRTILSKLCDLFDILDTTKTDISNAILSNISDFEDAVMVETAKREKMNCIVTHNEKNYINSSIPIFSPEKLVQKLN